MNMPLFQLASAQQAVLSTSEHDKRIFSRVDLVENVAVPRAKYEIRSGRFPGDLRHSLPSIVEPSHCFQPLTSLPRRARPDIKRRVLHCEPHPVDVDKARRFL